MSCCSCLVKIFIFSFPPFLDIDFQVMDYAGKMKQSPPEPRRRKKLIWILIGLVTLYLLLNHFWREKRWRYIVVHHTASDVGNLEYYRKLHMEERGWPDIAYHFIINNGSANTAMGEIEESTLWQERKNHYSTRISYINYFGIAVVLVGNFEKHAVPNLQREATVNLLLRLSQEYGIPPERIVGHRELQRTACPGKHLNMTEIRAAVRKTLNSAEE